MAASAISIKKVESLLEECGAEVPKSMFGTFPGVDAYVELEEEDRGEI